MYLIGFVLKVLFFPLKWLVRNKQEKLKEAYAKDPGFISDREAHLILKDLAWTEYSLKNYPKARDYSLELLRLNEIVERNWNYGNAIHHSHTVLGLAALQAGNIEESKEHLALSAKTPGSPQLDTFGPSLVLADRLLEKGEKKSVKKFLLNCGKFWKMDQGRISGWVQAIEAGDDLTLCSEKST